MSDSSKTVVPPDVPGSSKLELPTAPTRGSSVARTEPASAQGRGGVLSEQPTAISKKPPITGLAVTTPANSIEIAKTLVGRDLLHFRVDEFVGGGGMGAVFRGVDLSLGRTVAIKVLSREHADADMIRRFRHEAQSAAKLDHPGIPRVYFVGEQDGWSFIVFEFIEGENIRDYVARHGPLDIGRAIVFLADIADALHHASTRDVVHRDIKPSNVLVTREGEAKLVDMGLARTENLQSTAEDLTATGVTLGTFDYISPEQGRDPRNADIRSDIYSLGCTLYFMLTGRPPFPDGTMLQKLLSHTSDSPPDPSVFRADVPPRMTAMLARMLAKDPDHRFQDAGELIAEILLLAEEEQVELNPHRHSTVVIEQHVLRESFWQRHLPWVLPTVILVVTAFALQWMQFEPDAGPRLPEVEEPPATNVETDVDSIPLMTPLDGGIEPATNDVSRQKGLPDASAL